MSQTVLLWVVFNVVVVAFLILDLAVFNRKPHEISVREALVWSAIWIGLALLFNLGIYLVKGHDPALKFLTGYLLEKSLSVDNLFVFLLIFSYFCVPEMYQHRILFWGIIGALVMRAAFIAAGVALIHRFEWIIYVFGAFLVYTGVKLALEKDKEIEPEKNPLLRLLRRTGRVCECFENGFFFIRRNGKLLLTPLAVVLIVIETSDILFAMDSIPAILAITTDPFLVYSSNVFAILGLRALYFALAGVMRLFHHLHYGLSFILVFVGVKMLIKEYIHLPVWAALSVIAAAITLSIIASLKWPRPHVAPPAEACDNDPEKTQALLEGLKEKTK